MPPIKHQFRCTAAALALVAAALTATPAAAEKANLKSISFNAESVNTTLEVTSSDGQKWDTIKAGNVQFWGHMKVDTKWPGYVVEVAVVLGHCANSSCAYYPLIWSDGVGARDYNHQTNFSFSTSKIPVSSATGIAVVPYGDHIISKCNQHLAADGPTKSHSFTQQFDATMVVDTDKAVLNSNMLVEANADWPAFPHEFDHMRSDTFEVQVVCKPVIKPATNDVAFDHGAFDVKDVKLFLTTYQSNQPGSNPGTVCPALKVTSRAQANQAGPVSMRIWRQKNGGPITSEFQQVWASFDAVKNGYFATHETWENVGTTSHFQFKTEIVDNASPFAPFDGWKDIMVHCTNPGGGGLAPNPANNPDLPKPQAKWQGEVIVADSAGHDKSCPRKGQVFFEVTRPEPADFDYRISCSNGAFFTGTATGYNQGSGIYEAYGAHDLSINKTRTIQCTLQELQPAPVTVAVGTKDFTCNNPAIEPGADDLVSHPRPSTAKPLPPLVIVDPAPVCGRNETLVRGKCVARPVIVTACKKDERRVEGKCVKVPGVSIHCLPGFHQVGKKCVRKPVIVAECKRNEVRIDGKCVKKPDVSILCKPGFELVGKKCVRKPVVVAACKRSEIRVDGRCVKKPDVSILCKPGFKLVGKKCVRSPVVTTACAKGEKLVRGTCVATEAPARLKTLVAPKRALQKATTSETPRLPTAGKPRRALR